MEDGRDKLLQLFAEVTDIIFDKKLGVFSTREGNKLYIFKLMNLVDQAKYIIDNTTFFDSPPEEVKESLKVFIKNTERTIEKHKILI